MTENILLTNAILPKKLRRKIPNLVSESNVVCLNRFLSNIVRDKSKLLIRNLPIGNPLLYMPSALISKLLFVSITLLCIDTAYGQEELKFQIPYELLADERREEVREIAEKHTTVRFYKDIEFKIDESVLIFMIDHPVFLSATLRVMKIRDYLVKHDLEGMYAFDDRKGITGKFEVVYSAPGKRYYYGFGGYHGLILTLLGRGAAFYEYHGVQGNPSRTYVSIRVYSKVDNLILKILMKILKPIIVPLMDKKINKLVSETQKLANGITMHPENVYRVVKESGEADEKELEEFRMLVL